MVPFRVFDRVNKQMWQVINYHPNPDTGGSYLATKEDDSDEDGDIKIIPAQDLESYKFVDFMEESEPYGD